MHSSRTICLFLCLGLILLPGALLHAQDDNDAPAALPASSASVPASPVTAHADKTLHIGDSDVYEFDGMTTAAVGSPTVADIVPLSSRRLLVNAKGVGQTTLFVYDRRGKHRLVLAVVPPAPDLSPLAAQVQAEIGLPGVTARAVKDTVFLEGTVSSVVALQRAGAIAGVYTPEVQKPAPRRSPPKTTPPSLAGADLCRSADSKSSRYRNQSAGRRRQDHCADRRVCTGAQLLRRRTDAAESADAPGAQPRETQPACRQRCCR